MHSIVSVFSLSWVSLSYTLATSRCLGGLAYVLCIRLANNFGGESEEEDDVISPAATPGKLSTCKQDLDGRSCACT